MIAQSVIERVVEWLGPAYESFGYLFIAVGALLERSIFVGLVIPGDVIIALGGVYASRGEMDLRLVMATGSVFAIIGESLGYWLGRRYGLGLLRRLPLINRLADRVENAQEFFRRYGGWTVAVGRYATAAGAFIPFIAGVARMPYGKFLLFDIPAIILWAIGISAFGYVAGQNIELIDRVLSRFGYVVLGLLVAFFLTRWLLKRRKRRLEDGAEG